MGSAPSSPRNQISPPYRAWVGTRPITAKDVTDLPDPDSLQFPEFGLDEAEMLSTALTTLSSVKIQPVDCERLDSFTHRSLQGD